MKVALEKKLRELLNIGEDNIDRLSHAVSDISEECLTINNEIVPKIINSNSEDDMIENLMDLKNALEHILYHVEDASLIRLSYLKRGNQNISEVEA